MSNVAYLFRESGGTIFSGYFVLFDPNRGFGFAEPARNIVLRIQDSVNRGQDICYKDFEVEDTGVERPRQYRCLDDEDILELCEEDNGLRELFDLS